MKKRLFLIALALVMVVSVACASDTTPPRVRPDGRPLDRNRTT